jgi:hypothetical protein
MSDKAHEILKKYSVSHKISMTDIIDYLADLLDLHELLEPDWKDRVSEFVLSDFLQKNDVDMLKKVELKKIDAINKARNTAFNEYIKVLKPKRRKEFLEELLGADNLESGNILERFADYTLKSIDGRSKMVKVSESGKPIILGVNPDHIIPCEFGYHVVGEYCDCKNWRTCSIRQQEYGKYLQERGREPKKEIEDHTRFKRSSRYRLPDNR